VAGCHISKAHLNSDDLANNSFPLKLNTLNLAAYSFAAGWAHRQQFEQLQFGRGCWSLDMCLPPPIFMANQ